VAEALKLLAAALPAAAAASGEPAQAAIASVLAPLLVRLHALPGAPHAAGRHAAQRRLRSLLQEPCHAGHNRREPLSRRHTASLCGLSRCLRIALVRAVQRRCCRARQVAAAAPPHAARPQPALAALALRLVGALAAGGSAAAVRAALAALPADAKLRLQARLAPRSSHDPVAAALKE
jgi:hypothetical protein